MCKATTCIVKWDKHSLYIKHISKQMHNIWVAWEKIAILPFIFIWSKRKIISPELFVQHDTAKASRRQMFHTYQTFVVENWLQDWYSLLLITIIDVKSIFHKAFFIPIHSSFHRPQFALDTLLGMFECLLIVSWYRNQQFVIHKCKEGWINYIFLNNGSFEMMVAILEWRYIYVI